MPRMKRRDLLRAGAAYAWSGRSLLALAAGLRAPLAIASDSRTRPSSDTALADWDARSKAGGVVQAIRFQSAENVSAYTHPDQQADHVKFDPADGISGDGCLRIDVPAGDGAKSGTWRAPLNASWRSDRQGFGAGTPFYIQYRVKLGKNRLKPSHEGGGFKICNIAEYIPSSPGSSRSHSDNEIVIGNAYWRGSLLAYREHPITGTTSFETGDPTGRIHLQTALGNCLYQGGNASAGCWMFHEEEWFTVYYRICIAHYGPATKGAPQVDPLAAGNEIDIYVARAGESSYTHLYNNRSFAIGTDEALPLGLNGIWFLPYDTNRSSASYDTYHKYDQLIVSTEPILCPRV